MDDLMRLISTNENPGTYPELNSFLKFLKDPSRDVELEFCEDLNVIRGKVCSEVCQVEKNKVSEDNFRWLQSAD